MKKALKLYGLPVVDATEPLVLDVVKGDIHERGRRDPECCALSEACKRTLGVPRAIVYRSRLYIQQGDCFVRYELPQAAAAEVRAFDRGSGFTIGEYRITPVAPRDQRGKHLWDYGPVTRTGRPRGERARRQIEGVRHASPLYGGALEPPGRKEG